MYLSSFSIIEPQESVYLFYPGWLNVWESHMYNRSLKSTGAHGWGFKRFGTTKDIYAREMIRTPHYKKYIDAMDQVCDNALQQMSAKERMQLMKARTAFIYVDSWGESGPFEEISSALHTAMIDTLPKNLVKKFSIKDFTCKIRGEKQALTQAMKVAQDYLDWDIFDFVVICAAYRAVPVLAMSEEDIQTDKKARSKEKDIRLNLCVERVGCFIFSNRESALKVNCGHYVTPQSDAELQRGLLAQDADINLLAYAGLRKSEPVRALLASKPGEDPRAISLVDRYGASGCLSPALGWIYLEQQAQSGAHGKMRTVVPDNFGGYTWFDTAY
ncbi:ATP-binding protein [Enterobacteriaceae bacterium 4M9]|nr:ATP-binding protein [Enterobacteriaceae bacterium 4M9]